jgi:hypothetical protein
MAMMIAEDTLISPKELRRIADEKSMAEARKVSEAMERQEAEKRSLREAFLHRELHPEVRSRVSAVVKRAAERGEHEVLALQFSSSYCNDGGRRINNLETDWPKSLEGFAKHAYEFFEKELRPQGYKLRAQILDYPGGKPGDVGVFLSW